MQNRQRIGPSSSLEVDGRPGRGDGEVSVTSTPAPALSWLRVVVRRGGLSGSTIAVAAVLVTLAPGRAQPRRPEGAGFDFFASVETLAHSTGCGQRTVRDALAALTDAGLLLRVRRGGRRGTRDEASTWRLVLPSNTAENAGKGPEPNPSEAAGRAEAPTRPAAPVGDAPNPSEDSTWKPFPTGTPTGSHSTTKSVLVEADASTLTKSAQKPPALTRRPPNDAQPLMPARADFEDFWSIYPRKVGKGQARTAYACARRKVGAEVLLTAVEAQRHHLIRDGERFCPHASTWLNGERWLDDPSAIAPQPTSRQIRTDDLFAAAARRLGVDGQEVAP